ncbi:unnamed protein product [Candida verbasci]|uniref:Zn(2)-C6 fungal-type domain-containing protein n=1 Tax=Candida verbasci TaxID=1227364 RepID=A0A9W4XMV4_9ASCO|nr:unnamed protein product [Candida verbasci]
MSDSLITPPDSNTSMITKLPSKKRIRRLPPEKRQKVSTACDTCKKRKFKCSGSNPCDLCNKKGLQCSYTIIDKRSLKKVRLEKERREKERREKEKKEEEEEEGERQKLQQELEQRDQQQQQQQQQPLPGQLYHQQSSNYPQPQQQVAQPPQAAQPPPHDCNPNYQQHFQQPPLPYINYRQLPQHQQPSYHQLPHLSSQPQPLQPSPNYQSPHQVNANGLKMENGVITPEMTPTSSSNNQNNSHYIPKSLQPLLSLPLGTKSSHKGSMRPEGIEEDIKEEEGDISEEGEEGRTGVSNQSGKSSILLVDKSGTFRYMGETSPMSLLYEARNIFYQYVGKCKLTEDLRGCPVIDRPLKLKGKQLKPLPDDERVRDLYISTFKKNINDAFLVFDMNQFYKDVVEVVYEDPSDEESKEKLILLYFVLAIGSTYHDFENKIPDAKLGSEYFDSGLILSRECIKDSTMWCVQSHYLQFHYYQAILKKSTAWIHLNLAIKYAQSLGLHRNFVNEEFSQFAIESDYRKRLFRSLYSSDRISSVFIGRPLTINDYDWDDPTRFKSSNLLVSNLDFNSKCQIELAKISTMIGKIVANFYQNKIIDLNRTKKLAIELKLWSKNLDPLLAIDNILKPNEIPNNENQGNSFILLMTHLLHLYAIMLISRPFFMYEAVGALNADYKDQIQNKELSRQFCQAATKASILAIKLMNHYINTAFKNCKRMECYIIITCCFYSSIIIGISILNSNLEEDGYSENELIELLNNSTYILQNFSTCNKGAERYAEINIDLIDAVINRHKKKSESDMQPNNYDDFEKVLNDFNFLNDPNNNLQCLIEFQQFFVSHEAVRTTGSSSLPYDYGNYDLFFGDKL